MTADAARPVVGLPLVQPGLGGAGLACGDLPADVAVFAARREPNGYFWEGVVQYLAGSLLSQVELDPEAGSFFARGGPLSSWPATRRTGGVPRRPGQVSYRRLKSTRY